MPDSYRIRDMTAPGRVRFHIGPNTTTQALSEKPVILSGTRAAAIYTAGHRADREGLVVPRRDVGELSRAGLQRPRVPGSRTDPP